MARVRVLPGNGAIIINGIPYEEMFPRLEHRRAILQPLLVTDGESKYNVVAKVFQDKAVLFLMVSLEPWYRQTKGSNRYCARTDYSPVTHGLKRERKSGSSGLAKHLSTPSGKPLGQGES